MFILFTYIRLDKKVSFFLLIKLELLVLDSAVKLRRRLIIILTKRIFILSYAMPYILKTKLFY